MSQNLVSKRYFVTLPDGIAAALDGWAESENNKPSTLAAFLIERAIRDEIAKGTIPPISQSAIGDKDEQ